MSNLFDLFEGQPTTRRCSLKAQKRLNHRRWTLGARFDEREQREKIPSEIARECDSEDLFLLLEEHPSWLTLPPSILAEDFLSSQITAASLLRRMLVDLLAPLLEEDWYTRRQMLYEADKRPWTAEERELYLFLKAEPARLHRAHAIDAFQLLAGQFTLASLIRAMP